MNLNDNLRLANPTDTSPVQKRVPLASQVGFVAVSATVPGGFVWELISAGCQVNNASGTNDLIAFLTATTADGKIIYTSSLPAPLPFGNSMGCSWTVGAGNTFVRDDNNDVNASAPLPAGVLLYPGDKVIFSTASGDPQPGPVQVPILVLNEYEINDDHRAAEQIVDLLGEIAHVIDVRHALG